MSLNDDVPLSRSKRAPMTSEPEPDQPSSEPSDGADSGLVPEKELDDILVEASSLAVELSNEVGEANGPAETPQHRPASDEVVKLPQDLDAELSDLERLVAAAGGEVNETQPTDGEIASETPDEPPPEASPGSEAEIPDKDAPPADDGAIPDFMSEFTRPKEHADIEPPAPKAVADRKTPPDAGGEDGGSSRPAPVSKPGVVGPGIVGVVDTPDLLSMGLAPEQDELDTAIEGDASGSTRAAALNNLLRGAATQLSPVALAACKRAVTSLEAVNRPFDRLGDPIRGMLGWLAIATMGTALIVLLISLF